MKYDKEFRREAISKYLNGQSIASVSRETGVSEGVLHKWKQDLVRRDGEPDGEKLEMRKRIIELEMENEILKKATAIFTRSG